MKLNEVPIGRKVKMDKYTGNTATDDEFAGGSRCGTVDRILTQRPNRESEYFVTYEQVTLRHVDERGNPFFRAYHPDHVFGLTMVS